MLTGSSYGENLSLCRACKVAHLVPGSAAGPMLEQDGKEFSERWGYLSRAGLNDKSCLTRQIEKYADIYTSRVSNFLHYTCALPVRQQGPAAAREPKHRPSNKQTTSTRKYPCTA